MLIKYKLLLGGIFYKKLRLFLSLLGIIIGVSALLVMNSFGESAKVKTLKEIETFGPEVLMIIPGNVRVRAGRAIQTEFTTTLKIEDVKALKKIAGIKYISPIYHGECIVRYLRNNILTLIRGVNEEYIKLRNFSLIAGRNFYKEEIHTYKKVAILGYKVKRNLFGDKDAIGKIIFIRKLPFKVIGVLKPIGIDASGEDQDDQILVPYTTLMAAVFNVDYLTGIYISAEAPSYISSIEKQINEILLKRHKVNETNKDFTIIKAEDILEFKIKTTQIFSILVGTISVLCLLVGVLGVTAIMTLAVNERKKEIGIRKALGAREKDILFQFLIESVFITLLGGFIGIILGFLASFILLPLFKYPLIFPLKPIFISVFLTLIFGLIAGVYPAYKASKVDPMILLRELV